MSEYFESFKKATIAGLKMLVELMSAVGDILWVAIKEVGPFVLLWLIFNNL